MSKKQQNRKADKIVFENSLQKRVIPNIRPSELNREMAEDSFQENISDEIGARHTCRVPALLKRIYCVGAEFQNYVWPSFFQKAFDSDKILPHKKAKGLNCLRHWNTGILFYSSSMRRTEDSDTDMAGLEAVPFEKAFRIC